MHGVHAHILSHTCPTKIISRSLHQQVLPEDWVTRNQERGLILHSMLFQDIWFLKLCSSVTLSQNLSQCHLFLLVISNLQPPREQLPSVTRHILNNVPHKWPTQCFPIPQGPVTGTKCGGGHHRRVKVQVTGWEASIVADPGSAQVTNGANTSQHLLPLLSRLRNRPREPAPSDDRRG